MDLEDRLDILLTDDRIKKIAAIVGKTTEEELITEIVRLKKVESIAIERFVLRVKSDYGSFCPFCMSSFEHEESCIKWHLPEDKIH